MLFTKKSTNILTSIIKNTNKANTIFIVLISINTFVLLSIHWAYRYTDVEKSGTYIPYSLASTSFNDFMILCVIPQLFFLIFVYLTFKRIRNTDVYPWFRNCFFTFACMLSLCTIISIVQFFKLGSISLAKELGIIHISKPVGVALPIIKPYRIILHSLVLTIPALLLQALLKPNLRISRIDSRNKNSWVRRIQSAIPVPLLALSLVLYYGGKWVKRTFEEVNLDAIIFQMRVPVKGANNSIVLDLIGKCIVPAVLISLTLYILTSRIIGYKYRLSVQLRRKNISISISIVRPIRAVTLLMASIVVFIVSYHFLNVNYDLSTYIKNSVTSSDFIDGNYVDPRGVQLEFPEKKRNLIYIFMESMETTFLSKELGGALDDNAIPELGMLVQDNVNFSNSEKLGGAYQANAVGWTIGAMVAQHSGLPLKTPINENEYAGYDAFLPGIYNLGDVLKDAGYNQSLIVGSDAGFGGRRDYYEQHGGYNILDMTTAAGDGIMPAGYSNSFWGFEDEKLYNYAKKELSVLSQKDEPFNLVLLTVDTHFTDGYTCQLCGNEFEDKYRNVCACASRQVSDFIDWLQRQEYYDDTSIVITGDHLFMGTCLNEQISADYERTVLNVFINSAVGAADDSRYKNRTFSTMDMFPTTLASMGVSIEGERLGLGTNLFSDVPTYMESYGWDEVNKELERKSRLYDSFFQGK